MDRDEEPPAPPLSAPPRSEKGPKVLTPSTVIGLTFTQFWGGVVVLACGFWWFGTHVATREDLTRVATREDLTRVATREDVTRVDAELTKINAMLQELRTNVAILVHDDQKKTLP